MKIAVIGAGVIGLTCATVLQKYLKDAEITVIADKFGKETLSDGAAGLFRPFKVENEADKELYTDSFAHFSKLIYSDHSGDYGIQFVSGYMFTDTLQQLENLWFKELVLNFSILKPSEIRPVISKKHGCFFTSVVIECRKYLPALLQEFQIKGGKIVRQTIKNLNEINIINSSLKINEGYDTIILCTGLNSGDLLKDPNLMIPVRGQVVRIDAPWIKHFYYISDGENDFDTYIIPTTQSVVLGGSRDIGAWETAVNSQKSEEIVDKCSKIFPSIKKADILTEWVGLRPYLKSTLNTSLPKISAQPLADLTHEKDSGTILIHNYGHGGNGVSMSYGSAIRVLKLIQSSHELIYLAEKNDILNQKIRK